MYDDHTMIIQIGMTHSQLKGTIMSSVSSTNAHANKLHRILAVSLRLNLTTSRNLEKPKNPRKGANDGTLEFVRIKSH